MARVNFANRTRTDNTDADEWGAVTHKLTSSRAKTCCEEKLTSKFRKRDAEPGNLDMNSVAESLAGSFVNHLAQSRMRVNGCLDFFISRFKSNGQA